MMQDDVTITHCGKCHGLITRPSRYGCSTTCHVPATVSQMIVAAIEGDMLSRGGELEEAWHRMGDSQQVAIRDRWAEIIAKAIER